MMASGTGDPFNNSFDDDNDLLETDPLDGGMAEIQIRCCHQF